MDIHDMALTFQSMGHDVAVAAALPGKRRLVGYRVRQAVCGTYLLTSRHTVNGYETARVGHWLVPRLVEKLIKDQRPDLVIVQGGGAHRLAQVAVQQQIPVVIRRISVGAVEELASAARGDPGVRALLSHPLVQIVSVSQFVAAKAAELLDIETPVHYPLMRLADYRADRHTPQHVTFVNPIPFKGVDLVLQVAALLPQHQFLFAEAWPLGRKQGRTLQRQLAELPNVTFRPRSVGLKDVYRTTSVLLVPTQGEEAFGRVVIEAGANGIPVIATRVGGIPEALGDSGILFGLADPPELWAKALGHLLADTDCYARLRALAVRNAQRDDFDESAASRFLDLISDHATRRNLPPARLAPAAE
jgi:glycosyltransferase involved in cell wall biosynthesis